MESITFSQHCPLSSNLALYSYLLVRLFCAEVSSPQRRGLGNANSSLKALGCSKADFFLRFPCRARHGEEIDDVFRFGTIHSARIISLRSGKAAIQKQRELEGDSVMLRHGWLTLLLCGWRGKSSEAISQQTDERRCFGGKFLKVLALLV